MKIIFQIYLQKRVGCKISQTESGIYCIQNNVNNKRYIGQSKNIHTRWQKHKSELNNGTHFNDYLQKSWKKYGKDNFDFYVLEYCPIDLLDEKERYYIALYNTMDRSYGYNLKSGGQDSNGVYSDETKRKMSISTKKSFENPERRKLQSINAFRQWSDPAIKAKISGKNNYMYGKHHTQETKDKISAAHKGVPSIRRNRTPVLCVELQRIFCDAVTAGQELHLDSGAIIKVCQKKRKTCGGYHWEFTTMGNNQS